MQAERAASDCFGIRKAPPVGLAAEAVDRLVARSGKWWVTVEETCDKRIDTLFGRLLFGDVEDRGIRVVIRFRIVAHVAATADVLTLGIARHAARLLEEGGDLQVGLSVASGRAVYAYEDLQPFSTGADEHRQREVQHPEDKDQCRKVLHMVEIQPDNLTVRFDRTCLMPSLEYPRRGESRQSAFQTAGLFGAPFCECGAVGDDFTLPPAAPDQDNDFFKS